MNLYTNLAVTTNLYLLFLNVKEAPTIIQCKRKPTPEHKANQVLFVYFTAIIQTILFQKSSVFAFKLGPQNT